MNFAQALHLIRNGNRLARKGWNRDGMAVRKSWGDDETTGRLRLLFDARDLRAPGVPWLPKQTDMLADDWYVVGGDAGNSGPIAGSFSEALDHLLEGGRATRGGWHGTDQFIFLVPGSTFEVNRPPLLGIYPEGTVIHYQPHIDIRLQATGGYRVGSPHGEHRIAPWSPDNSDLFADDWTAIFDS